MSACTWRSRRLRGAKRAYTAVSAGYPRGTAATIPIGRDILGPQSGDLMSTWRLDRLVAPRSLAIVGAGPREASFGGAVIRNVLAAKFPGPVHLVNPRHPEIEGLKTVASLDALSPAPDLVVITVPPAMVPGIVETAGRNGAAAAIIITAGLGHGPGSLAEAA